MADESQMTVEEALSAAGKLYAEYHKRLAANPHAIWSGIRPRLSGPPTATACGIGRKGIPMHVFRTGRVECCCGWTVDEVGHGFRMIAEDTMTAETLVVRAE